MVAHAIFVTHDQDEALELADRVLVMNRGPHRTNQRIRTKCFIIRGTEFVVKFLGQVNPFHGRLEDGKVHFASRCRWTRPSRRRCTPSRSSAGVCPAARFRGRYAPQRASLFSARWSRGGMTRLAPMCVWISWPNRGRAAARRIDPGALSRLGHQHRQPGLRDAPRGEGLFQRGVKTGGQSWRVWASCPRRTPAG